jgi:hypothetical protein
MKHPRKIIATGVVGLVSLILLTPVALSRAASTNQETLGLTVSIVPSKSGVETPIQAGLKNAVALTIPPGKSATRFVRIQSASKNSELITTSVGYAARINGVLTLEDNQQSDIAPWVKMNINQMVLKPLQTVELALSFDVPAKEPIGIREAYLLVKATEANPPAKGVISLAGAARYAVPIYLGVGTTTQIVTSFTVGIITLVNTTGGTAFAVPLINTGMTPVDPVGYLTLGSVLGQLNFAAQIPFGNGVIAPGGSEVIKVVVPAEVPDAVWNVHADVHQGSMHATSDSIVTLKRKGIGNSAQIKYYRILVGVISLVLFFFIFLYIRRGHKESDRLDAVEVKSDLAEVTLATFNRDEKKATRIAKDKRDDLDAQVERDSKDKGG